MAAEKIEETVYIKIGILGKADEAVSVVTFLWHPDMQADDLESLVNFQLNKAAKEAGKEFEVILNRHITESMEKLDRDDDSE